jgi:hypothetical protein
MYKKVKDLFFDTSFRQAMLDNTILRNWKLNNEHGWYSAPYPSAAFCFCVLLIIN